MLSYGKKNTKVQEILHAVTERTRTIALLTCNTQGMSHDGTAHQKECYTSSLQIVVVNRLADEA